MTFNSGIKRTHWITRYWFICLSILYLITYLLWFVKIDFAYLLYMALLDIWFICSRIVEYVIVSIYVYELWHSILQCSRKAGIWHAVLLTPYYESPSFTISLLGTTPISNRIPWCLGPGMALSSSCCSFFSGHSSPEMVEKVGNDWWHFWPFQPKIHKSQGEKEESCLISSCFSRKWRPFLRCVVNVLEVYFTFVAGA